jgi:hypothetical protein
VSELPPVSGQNSQFVSSASGQGSQNEVTFSGQNSQPIVSKAQRKVERSKLVKFPWLNSDAINLIKLKILSCEAEEMISEPLIASENVNINGEPQIIKLRVFSVHTLPYILAMVKGQPEQLFVDTGSSLCLASYEAYSDEPILPVDGIELTSASGHIIPLEGKITLNTMVGNLDLPIDFVLIKGLELKLLLGNSVFKAFDFQLNYSDMKCEFAHKGKNSGSIPLLLLECPPQITQLS